MLLTLLGVVVALAVFVALLLLWVHRSTLASFVPGVPFYDHHPYYGIWPVEVRNVPRYYDWKLSQAERAQSEGHEILQRVGPFLSALEVHSPRMLQYILKDNFDNFEKGDRFRGAFHVFLGGGIFNSDFEQWRNQRKLASHMFSAAKLNHCMLDTFIERSGTVLELLDEQLDAQRKAVANGQTAPHLDLQSLFNSYTMDSMMQIGFGMQLDSMRSATPPAFVGAFDDMQEAIMHRLMGPTFVYRFQRLFGLGREPQLTRSLPVIDDFVFGIIKKRKENAQQFADSGDLLSLFVADAAKTAAVKAAAAGGDAAATVSGEDALSDRELRDIVLNFMIVASHAQTACRAGRDTTAALLTWLFYELSQHPEVERRVVEEIDSVLGAIPENVRAGPDRTAARAAALAGISQDALRRLVYLEAVILETLRLHPSIPINSKVSVRACTFPDGTHVPAGKIVSFSPYIFGRMESIWGSDVLDFNPDRFLSEPDSQGARSLVQPSPFAFPAFHAGPRTCLGRGMALMNAKTLASGVLRRFRLRVKEGHDPMYKISIVLVQRDGLPVTVQERE